MIINLVGAMTMIMVMETTPSCNRMESLPVGPVTTYECMKNVCDPYVEEAKQLPEVSRACVCFTVEDEHMVRTQEDLDDNSDVHYTPCG